MLKKSTLGVSRLVGNEKEVESFMVNEFLQQGAAAWKDLPEPAQRFYEAYAPLWLERRLRTRR